MSYHRATASQKLRHRLNGLLRMLVGCSLLATSVAQAQMTDQPSGLRGFAKEESEEMVPDFGIGTIRFPYTQSDLDDARRLLRRFDRDDSGTLEPDEVSESSWTRGSPFDFDLNHDQKVSLIELTQREAWSRRQTTRPPTFSWLARRLEQAKPSSTLEISTTIGYRGEETSRDSRSITINILQQYDRNQDRSLSEWERRSLGIQTADADLDADGELDFRELDRWVFRQIDQKVNDLSEIMPDWFFEKDANRDGQIEMAEFAQEWTSEQLLEFETLDSNQDGVITTTEMLAAKSVVGGVFESRKAVVLKPRELALSDIEVEEDFKIAKLKVQLSLTHSYLEQLDGILIGPDGQRIELFSRVGGSDDVMMETVFDDTSNERIRQGRAPFRGNYQPIAVEQRKPGLAHYQGKSIQGVWQLLIESDRSDRFGILHHWSLIVEPAEEPSEPETSPTP